MAAYFSSEKSAMSAGVGGRPVRSRNRRRTSVMRSASAAGFSACLASSRSMKASMGLPLFEAGTAGRRIGSKAQCAWYSAPSAIQRFKMPASALVSGLGDDGGGITSSGSVVVMRWMISLASKSGDSTSSRRPASRLSSSGPWQAKHFEARMGRTSRLYPRGFSAAKRPEARRSVNVRMRRMLQRVCRSVNAA